MGLTDVFSAAASSVTQNLGNIEKAVIEVVDLRGREINLQSAVPVIGGNQLPGFGSAVPGAGSLINKGSLNDYIGGVLGLNNEKLQLEEEYLKGLAERKRRFTVQFNPSSLRLSGHSGGMANMLDYHEGNNNEATYGSVVTTVSLSVELLFDSMDPQDAFAGDKTNLAPTNVAKGVANAFLSKKKKKTVQRQVEGFIGALRNEHTRLITFNWGDFCYSGVLRNVNAEYTMFNVTGEPVRAIVALSIMCADASLWPNSLAVWQERYKQSFNKGSESFSKTTTFEQKAGSLLNL